jgi:DNA-nicking Smr family endonuclease
MSVRGWFSSFWRRPPRADEPPEHQPDEPDEPGEPPGAAAPSDELDLHTFLPKEVASVVEEYVSWAAEAGLGRVRIVHGKGSGTLRRTVHAVLARHPMVLAHGLCDERSGGWGATWATLRTTG